MRNQYDEERFFTKYSGMLRSQKGLEGAGEWSTLQTMLPDFSGKRVLDLGCGFGWHCIYAARQGAAQVVGVDLSTKMLQQARKRNSAPQITYLRQSIEQADFPAASFDVVISSLALHYVASFDVVCKRVNRFLDQNGVFIFSVEHPVFTAQGPQEWHYDQNGAIMHWPVDRYFEEGWRHAAFLGEPVVKYHRTLTSYLSGLLQSGFTLCALAEPQPPEHMLGLPGMKEERRRPMMLLIAAKKAG